MAALFPSAHMTNAQRNSLREAFLGEEAGRRFFRLEDVKVGQSVMGGRTTSDRFNYGTVTEIIPGVGFRVDNGYWPSILWRDFRLLEDSPADARARPDFFPGWRDGDSYASAYVASASAAGSEPEPESSPSLRRTDSGADYGEPGYPDCDFWESQSIQAVYVATAAHYSRIAEERLSGNGSGAVLTPDEMTKVRTMLTVAGRPSEKGPAQRAWDAQMAGYQLPQMLPLPPLPPSPSPPPSSLPCPTWPLVRHGPTSIMASPMNITPPPSPPRLQSPPHEEDDDMPDLEDISEEEEAAEAEEAEEAEDAPRTPENQRITSSAEPPDAPLRLRLRRPPPDITDLEPAMLVLSADERMEPCAGFLLLLGGLTVIAYGAAAAAVYMGSF